MKTTKEMLYENGFYVEGTGGGCEAMVREFNGYTIAMSCNLGLPDSPYDPDCESIFLGVYPTDTDGSWGEIEPIYVIEFTTLSEFFYGWVSTCKVCEVVLTADNFGCTDEHDIKSGYCTDHTPEFI